MMNICGNARVLPDAKQWKAADYARISREDGDKEESDSIGTQFDIIDDYIAHNDDITFVDRYSDDGWSGTNFDRPDFMRLMEDIKRKNQLCHCQRFIPVRPKLYFSGSVS